MTYSKDAMIENEDLMPASNGQIWESLTGHSESMLNLKDGVQFWSFGFGNVWVESLHQLAREDNSVSKAQPGPVFPIQTSFQIQALPDSATSRGDRSPGRAFRFRKNWWASCVYIRNMKKGMPRLYPRSGIKLSRNYASALRSLLAYGSQGRCLFFGN